MTTQTPIVLPPRLAAERLGISLSTLTRLRMSGAIPMPIRLSERRLAWRVADLDDFLASRAHDASKAEGRRR